jgi:glycerol kinase
LRPLLVLVSPPRSWAEHSPLELLASVQSCVESLFTSEPHIDPASVVSVGITNQRETTIAWDTRTGKPLYNAIVWHDTRTEGLVTEMSARYAGGVDHFRDTSGLPLSTYFSALKMNWLLTHVPEVAAAVAEGRAAFGTVDSWLIWNLTGGAHDGAKPVHVTDVSNASRTMLMNLHTLEWDEYNCM